MSDYEMSPEVESATILKLAAETDLLNLKRDAEKLELELRNEEVLDQKASAEEHRIFAFYVPMGLNSTAACIQTLGYWARRPDPDEKPFTIEICSPGGSVLQGFALIDYIRALRAEGHKINTVGLGWVASMAAVLLQAGEKRTIGKNSWLMVHEVQSEATGALSEMDDHSKLMKRFNDRLYDLLSERSTLTRKEIERRAKRRDWWLDADEALQAGFVDEIV